MLLIESLLNGFANKTFCKNNSQIWIYILRKTKFKKSNSLFIK